MKLRPLHIVAAFTVLGLAFCASLAFSASDPDWGIKLPPVEFEYKPIRPVVEVGLDLFEVNRVCHELGSPPELRVWGCALTELHWCLIFVPRGVPQSFTHIIRRHERGHCNGWRHE